MPIHLYVLLNKSSSKPIKYALLFLFLFYRWEMWASKNLPTATEPEMGRRPMIKNIWLQHLWFLYSTHCFTPVQDFQQLRHLNNLTLEHVTGKPIKGVKEYQWRGEGLSWWMSGIYIFWPNWPSTLYCILRWFCHGVHFLKWLLSAAT